MKGSSTGNIGTLLLLRKLWAGVLNIFIISFIARLLDKSDFGLLVVSGVFISFMDTLGPASIGEYLIYYDDKEKPGVINSAFWLNLFIHVIIICITIILAPYWAHYYNNDKIKYMTYLLAAGFFGSIFSAIPTAMLKKRMDFKPVIFIQAITGTLFQLTQLALAIIGFGVYSLAIPTAIFPLVAGIYLFYKARPAIKLNFGTKYWVEIIRYIRYSIGSKILSRLSNDGDSLIIGKMTGLAALGVYNISSKLSNLLNQNIMPILDDVSMPLFVKNNTKYTIIRKQFLYVIRVTSLFLTPFYFLLIIFAPIIITSLYGEKWVDAILPLQILCICSLVKTISYPTATLFYALGKPKIDFYTTLIYAPVFLLLVWIFSQKGLIAACIVIAALRIVNTMYYIYKSGSLISLTFFNFFSEIKHLVIANLLLGGLTLVTLHFLHNLNLKYLMMVFYMPSAYFLTYLLYKKRMLKDYLLIYKFFPALNFIRNKTVPGINA
ncbi:MAG: oligosaccharide flippase family protein [Taibaiella sp.]|nr:oligosaccharide flippase family protein [Taibaiella sp.]